jgi:hypothetical protein
LDTHFRSVLADKIFPQRNKLSLEVPLLTQTKSLTTSDLVLKKQMTVGMYMKYDGSVTSYLATNNKTGLSRELLGKAIP